MKSSKCVLLLASFNFLVLSLLAINHFVPENAFALGGGISFHEENSGGGEDPQKEPAPCDDPDSAECNDCLKDCDRYDDAKEHTVNCRCGEEEINCTADIHEYYDDLKYECIDSCF